MKTDRLAPLINHYAESHRNPANEAIHCICVPAILFAVLGWLLSVNIVLALAVICLAIAYYIRLSVRAAMEMTFVFGLMLVIWLTLIPAHHMFLFALCIFVIAWIGQFVGHAIEGAKPSFVEDLQYLMIGPVFVIAVLKARMRGARKFASH